MTTDLTAIDTEIPSDDPTESIASSADTKDEYSLPLWIRKRTYSEVPEEADKQLWEDIHKQDELTGGSFLEEKFLKYIFIDAETRKPYVEMPTTYHHSVVRKLISFVDKQSTEDHPVLATACGSVLLKNDRYKEPDVYIFGEKRTCFDEDDELSKKRTHAELYEPNPHAIIEVSWTNKIEDELEKFTVQMRDCKIENHGAIKVGYLITFIPLKEMPTQVNRVPPLVGIDVYRMKSGDEDPTKLVKWRYDEEYPEDLKITAEDLEQETGGEGVSIPFRILESAVTRCGIKFQKPVEN